MQGEASNQAVSVIDAVFEACHGKPAADVRWALYRRLAAVGLSMDFRTMSAVAEAISVGDRDEAQRIGGDARVASMGGLGPGQPDAP